MPEYPLVDIAVVIGSQSFVGEALPASGYSGGVMVPLDVARELVDSEDHTDVVLGDGWEVVIESWLGELLLEDRSFPVIVSALGDQFLIGRQVLDQLEICFVFGREVRLRFAPGD